MAVVGELVTLFVGNNTQLLASTAQSQAAMTGYAASSATAFSAIQTGALAAGAAAIVGMGLATNAAGDFQAAMSSINTIAHMTPEQLAGIGDQIRQLAAQTGTSLPDLTSSFYDLLSVGVPVADAMTVLANANTLAIGGLSTTSEATNALTSAMNAWSVAGGEAKLTMADSTKVMDIFAQSIAMGGLTAADLPTAIANVASSAAAMNVPLEAVGATLAVMTTRGFTASTAATAMNRALIALQTVPPGMRELQETTGKTYETIARTEGVQAAMQQLVADAQRHGVALNKVFGTQEAVDFARNVAGPAAAAYASALEAMYGSAGVAAAQAAEKAGDFNTATDKAGASVNNLAITVGNELLPSATDLANKVGSIVQGMSDWAAANPGVASTVLAIVAGVGLLAAGVVAVNAALALTALLLSPLVIIAALLAAAVMNMDKLVAGARVVQEALGPQEPAQAFRERFFGTHGRMPSPLEWGQYQAGIASPLWGDFNTPGFGAGEVGSPYAGPMTPPGLIPQFANGGVVPGFGPQLAIVHGGETITPGGRDAGRSTHVIHNHIHLNGVELKNWIERELYNDAAGFTSGFSPASVGG